MFGGGHGEHIVDKGGEFGSERADRRDRIVQLALHERRLVGCVGERSATGEQRVGDDRQRVHVGLRPDRFAAQLLRRREDR